LPWDLAGEPGVGPTGTTRRRPTIARSARPICAVANAPRRPAPPIRP